LSLVNIHWFAPFVFSPTVVSGLQKATKINGIGTLKCATQQVMIKVGTLAT
jgi:hypothetical protein